jgi:hypothetical protein
MRSVPEKSNQGETSGILRDEKLGTSKNYTPTGSFRQRKNSITAGARGFPLLVMTPRFTRDIGRSTGSIVTSPYFE